MERGVIYLIRYFVMDVDGTLTDGKIYMGNDGEVMKAFSIKDGCGIKDILIPHGVMPVIITGRKSKILENRCAEIGVEAVYQGIGDKVETLKKVCKDIGTVAYIGDDINDLPAMKLVKESGGVVGCPGDAVDAVKKIADYVCVRNGGDGAVREFLEWIIDRKV